MQTRLGKNLKHKKDEGMVYDFHLRKRIRENRKVYLLEVRGRKKMKINLSKKETEALIDVLSRRMNRIRIRIHRKVNPGCKLCERELVLIKKLKNALKKNGN